jgi:hypothetical protein
VLTCSSSLFVVKALLSHQINKLLELLSVDNKPAAGTTGVPRRGASCSEVAGRFQEEHRLAYACERSLQAISYRVLVTILTTLQLHATYISASAGLRL